MSLSFTITIDDQTILTHLERYDEDQREQIALVALRIGLQALNHASGSIDTTQLQRIAERVVQDALTGMRETLQEQFSTDNEDSALKRIFNISAEHYARIHDEIKELKIRKKSQRETSQGGKVFEGTLGEVLVKLASDAGDRYEATVDAVGYLKGAKVGDFVVTLGEQSHAPGIAIAIEAKRDDKYTIKMVLDECRRCRENRRAQVAIFVWDETYGRNKNQPPLMRYDHDIVVLWNEDNPDTDVYVQAAYWLARGLCQLKTQSQQTHQAMLQAQADATIDQIDKLDNVLTKIRQAGEKAAKESQFVMTQTNTLQGMLKGYVETLRSLAQMQMVGSITTIADDGNGANSEALTVADDGNAIIAAT